MNDAQKPEFSYFVNIDDIGKSEKHHKLEATQEQCDALVKRFALGGLADFKAHLIIKDAGRGQGITLMGQLFAVAFQKPASAAGGEAMKMVIEDTINIRFLPEARITPALEEENLMTLDSEDLEILPEDKIDLGELMSQYLALSIDPLLYEELASETTDLGEGISFNEPESLRPNPFAVLSGLKDKLDKEDNS